MRRRNNDQRDVTQPPTQMRVVVTCGDGLYQRALCVHIASQHQLVGVVLYSPRRSKGPFVARLRRVLRPLAALRYLRTRWLISRYDEAVRPLMRRLFFVDGSEPQIPKGVPVIRVEDVNSRQVVDFVQRIQPDIVCVNGTNLLRGPILALIPGLRYGIINMHTGLSPYSRGGNCNLFMLLEGRPEMVGVTIHHIDRGIDSGDIVISARPELELADTYEAIEAKTFHLGNRLVTLAIQQLLEERAARVPQWEAGKLFLRRTGYVYEPSARVRANRLIEQGLIRDYIPRRRERDGAIRLVGKTE